MLILRVCGIIRSLSRVLLGFVIGVVFDVGVLCECDVLGDILFICVGFIRAWVSRVVKQGRGEMVWRWVSLLWFLR